MKMEIIRETDDYTKFKCHCGKSIVVPKKNDTLKSNYIVNDKGERLAKCPECGCVNNGSEITRPSEIAARRMAERTVKFFACFFVLDDDPQLVGVGADYDILIFVNEMSTKMRGVIPSTQVIIFKEVDAEEYDKIALQITSEMSSLFKILKGLR